MGTIRSVPMCHGLTLTEKLLLNTSSEQDKAIPDGSWEMGRLVLAPESRGGVDLLARCAGMALNFLAKQADAAHLFASCSDALSRLYRLYGFSVYRNQVVLEGTGKTYTVIHGDAGRVAASLARIGARAARSTSNHQGIFGHERQFQRHAEA